MAKRFYTKDFMEENTYEIPSRPNFEDITGQKFGKVSVVCWAGINKYGNWKSPRNVWWCKCDCGKTDYFLVDKPSLKKGLTASCGCNYKNNGGTVADSVEEAENTLKGDYKLLEYSGRRKPCKVKCKDCGDVESFDSFYSVQQRGIWCSCIDRDEFPKKLASSTDYTFIRRLESRKIEASCNKCGTIKIASTTKSNWLDECPCKYGVDPDSESKPSCVYFNIDEYNPSYFKIGKADEPYSRLNQVMTSVKAAGYKDTHKFKIKHIKWFANEKVAYQVESLYHKWFKDKAVYGYKGTKGATNVFDGSNELFEVTKEDVEDFNESYKDFVDRLEIDKPEYAITKDFSSSLNIQKPKGKLGVDVWFPRIGKLYEYIKIERQPWKDEIINTSDNLIEAYLKIRKEERSRMLEVDGDYYEGWADFYAQWSHLSAVELKTFRDRVITKKRDIWESLISPRERKIDNKFYDADGTQKSLSELYRVHKPLISYTRFKDRLLSGESLLEVVNHVPKDSYTKIYMFEGKYYSNMQLYKNLDSVVRKPIFSTRLERGWHPLVAALIPAGNVYRYSRLIKDLETLYPEIYPKLKEVV